MSFVTILLPAGAGTADNPSRTAAQHVCQPTVADRRLPFATSAKDEWLSQGRAGAANMPMKFAPGASFAMGGFTIPDSVRHQRRALPPWT
jgi:hypothetical protein